MRYFLLLTLSMLICDFASAYAFPSLRDLCRSQADATYQMTSNCHWVPDPLTYTEYIANGNWMCTGRLVCDSVGDPTLAAYPYEIKLAKCNNGPKKCNPTGSMTARPAMSAVCRASFKTMDKALCDNL